MYKKIVITFLIFITPVPIVKKHIQNKSSQLSIKKNSLHLAELLYDTNEENGIEIDNYWKERDLASQRQHYSYDKNFFNYF